MASNKTNWGNSPLIVITQVIASLISIFVFVTGIQTVYQLFYQATPPKNIQPTVVDSTSTSTLITTPLLPSQTAQTLQIPQLYTVVPSLLPSSTPGLQQSVTPIRMPVTSVPTITFTATKTPNISPTSTFQSNLASTSTQIPTQNLLFTEDFEDNSFDNWTSINKQLWQIVSEGNNHYLHSKNETISTPYTDFWMPIYTVPNLFYEVNFRVGNNSTCDFFVREAINGKFYDIRIVPDKKLILVGDSSESGTSWGFTEVQYFVNPDDWHRLLIIVDTKLTIFIDDKKIFAGDNAYIRYKSIGFDSNGLSDFDQIRVWYVSN